MKNGLQQHLISNNDIIHLDHRDDAVPVYFTLVLLRAVFQLASLPTDLYK